MLQIMTMLEIFFTPFGIRLKPDANLRTQRPTKVFIYDPNKPNTFLDSLQKNGIIKRVSPTPHEKPNYGTSFPNPLKIMKKNDSFEILLDSNKPNTLLDSLQKKRNDKTS